MSWLAENCPRLYRAIQEERAIRAARERRRRKKERQLLQVQRLVEHRDLQLLRSTQTRDRRYVAQRAQKLAQAKRALEHVTADLAEVDHWEPERRAA